MTMLFGDPRVATVERTCGACPEQYEGTLTDGRPFYFRYRHGWAGLGIGHGDERFRANDAGMAVGDGLAGSFESEEERDGVFWRLLDEATGSFRVLIDPKLFFGSDVELTDDQVQRIAAILREAE